MLFSINEKREEKRGGGKKRVERGCATLAILPSHIAPPPSTEPGRLRTTLRYHRLARMAARLATAPLTA